MADPYEWVPLRTYLTFFESAVERLAMPSLGLELGRRFAPQDLGPLGLMFMSTGDVLQGFQQLQLFISAWQEGTEMRVILGGGMMRWMYRVTSPDLRKLRAQDAELSLTVMTAWMRNRLGPRWCPTEVHFEHAAPDNVRPYVSYFGAPVHFRRAFNVLIFEHEDNNVRKDMANASFLPFIRRHLEDLIEPIEDLPMAEAVRRVVATLLHAGGGSVEKIAAVLGLSPRTLQRRLTNERSSLRAIIRDKRHRAAEMLIEKRNASGMTLATALGYGDASAFSRAYRQWAGQSPSMWQKAQEAEMDGLGGETIPSRRD